MKIICEDTLCSGCSACACICPQNAIQMVKNPRGFLYPQINKNACIDCGVCIRVCQCHHEPLVRSDMHAYATRSDDSKIIKTSQSGGLSAEIARYVLSLGGTCYGAAVCEDLVVRYIRVTQMSELHSLQKTKYVQSDPGNTFRLIEGDLSTTKSVLVTGTSCYIDGLLRYLKQHNINTERLFTCDLICHGVPSPLVLSSNLKRIEKTHAQEIESVLFRDKRFGWSSSVETYILKDHSEINEAYYTKLFYSHLILRECCFHCQYIDASKKSADITMADFWGIEKYITDVKNDNAGWSLAVVHSEKGQRLLQNASLNCIEVDVCQALQGNHHSLHKKPLLYDKFWYDYSRSSFEYCLKKYTDYGGILLKIKRKVLEYLMMNW